MNNSNRRKFLKTASIFSVSVVASRHVFASTVNETLPLGSSSKTLQDGISVTEWLSQYLGKLVVSSIDQYGNWIISIGGSDWIPLSFSLNEVVITSTGKVIDFVSKSDIFNGPYWAPPDVQGDFAAAASRPSDSPPSLMSGPMARPAGRGSDGMSVVDVVGMVNTSLGLAVSHATVAANAASLELALELSTANRVFGVIDMVGNFGELVFSDQDALHQWEDAGQLALGFALTFTPVGPVALVAGGIVLTAWELWEYRRDN